MKILDFCLEQQLWVLVFLFAGFSIFARFGPGLQVPVPLKAPFFQIRLKKLANRFLDHFIAIYSYFE